MVHNIVKYGMPGPAIQPPGAHVTTPSMPLSATDVDTKDVAVSRCALAVTATKHTVLH